jgi:epoxyqueuosine reductase
MKIPVEEQYKYVKLTLPDGSKAEGQAVLLHACCAPCSAAIVECMLRNGMKPTVYFSNSNIYPQQEYDVRKHELKRFLEAQNVPYVEDEYDHQEWLSVIKGLEDEPERGSRCSVCFQFRLSHAAKYAQEHGFHLLTTTLASSLWKISRSQTSLVWKPVTGTSTST